MANKKSKTISLNPAIRLVERLNLIVGLRSDGNVKLTVRRMSITGEFVHPNVIYSMEIDAKVRRLVVGAALGNAG